MTDQNQTPTSSAPVVTWDDATEAALTAPAAARGFHHLSAAWYASANLPTENGAVDDVEFGMYYPDGSAETGSMRLSWYDISGVDVPRLEAFDDAFPLLLTFADVLGMLATAPEELTPLQFCDLLTSLGFADLTKRTR